MKDQYTWWMITCEGTITTLPEWDKASVIFPTKKDARAFMKRVIGDKKLKIEEVELRRLRGPA